MAKIVIVHTDDDAMTIKFKGNFNFNDWPEFNEKCLGYDYPKKIYLDFSELTGINIAGLGMILLLSEKMPRYSDKIKIISCSDKIRQFLDCVDFERWLASGQMSADQYAVAC